MAGDGGQLPWLVQYDVDFPVDAAYTLHVRYAAAESRPLELWLDGQSAGKCCEGVTGNSPPDQGRRPKLPDAPPRHPWNRHGAEWKEAGKLSVTKGKHTLKLTCDGPPPNVIALRLESPVAFPKDWKPAGPAVRLPQGHGAERTRYELGWEQAGLEAKISRIPAVYRTAFLPPGSVNVATLRLAIEDMIAEFGPRYPTGPRYLKQLDALEKKQTAANRGMPRQTQEIEDALVSLRREAMLAHPLLNFDKLYDRSYENFIDKGLVSHLNDGYGAANVPPELPLTFGSHRSKLVERIRRAPCQANLTREEFIRIVTWIDANAPYYGTHRGKKNVKWKGDSEFRPLPLAGK